MRLVPIASVCSIQPASRRDVDVRVTSRGHVTWTTPTVFSLICPFEFRSDSWRCVIELGSWSRGVDRVTLVGSSELDTSHFDGSERWKLASQSGELSRRRFESKSKFEFWVLSYVLQLSRHSGWSALGKRHRHY